MSAGPGSERALPAHATEPLWLRVVLCLLALALAALLLVLPLVAVFTEALRRGWAVFLAAFADPDAQAAIRLTLIVAAITVPLNLIFGLACAWTVTKFRFRGRTLLLTALDLPLSVSPVVSGLIFVLLFGAQAALGRFLQDDLEIRIIFALPGIVIATAFVTFPYVARELIPALEDQGNSAEEAALTLGASGLRTLLRVTLPGAGWALLYGVLLTNARAMGEFGAVSVVSNSIRGETATMPLFIEMLYNEYAFSAAFAMASALAVLALAAVIVKQVWALIQRQRRGDA